MPYTQGEFISTANSASANVNCGDTTVSFMNNDEIVHVTKKTFAKNKILDQQAVLNFSTKHLSELPAVSENSNHEHQNFTQYLGKMNTSRPLTYPYTSDMHMENSKTKLNDTIEDSKLSSRPLENKTELKSIRHFQVIQNYNYDLHSAKKIEPPSNVIAFVDRKSVVSPVSLTYEKPVGDIKVNEEIVSPKPLLKSPQVQLPIVKVNDKVILEDSNESSVADLRKRKISVVENAYKPKIQRNDEVMDLSMRFTIPEIRKSPVSSNSKYNGSVDNPHHIGNVTHADVWVHDMSFKPVNHAVIDTRRKSWERPKVAASYKDDDYHMRNAYGDRDSVSLKQDIVQKNEENSHNNAVDISRKGWEQQKKVIGLKDDEYKIRTVYGDRNAVSVKPDVAQNSEDSSHVNISYVIRDAVVLPVTEGGGIGVFKSAEYDNSAMETLADIATKQVKLEKNSVAMNVASEFLKLATKNEFPVSDGLKDCGGFVKSGKDVNDLIVKPEENRSCTICSKSFSKPSQLR